MLIEREKEENLQNRESVSEYLARGGKVTVGKTKKAKGFVGLSHGVRTGSKNRGREMAIRAAIKFVRAAGK